jgi:hypothetical protein
MELIIPTLRKYFNYIQNELGYNVVFVGLYGSQNYNLATKDSDIDARAIVVPTFEDLIINKKYIHQVDFPEGICVVDDIRDFCKNTSKGSPSDLEMFYTKYFVTNNDWISNFINPDSGEKIINAYRDNFLRALAGVTNRTIVETKKRTNRNYIKIDKDGFDGKKFASTIRTAKLFKDIAYYRENKQNPFWAKEEMAVVLRKIKLNLCSLNAVDNGLNRSKEVIDRMVQDGVIEQAKWSAEGFRKNYDIMQIAYDIIREYNLEKFKNENT